MKQDTGKILIAVFLALTMVFSVFALFFGGPTDSEQTPETEQEKFNPEFWTINEPFFDLSDALKLTPPYAFSAFYLDVESMTPQMMQWARQNVSILNEVDSLYKSSTTKVYYARLNDSTGESFLLLSTMFPEKNDFEFIERPGTYPPILIRQEQGIAGIYNILGTPAIFAPPNTAIDVLEILFSMNKTATAYDTFEGLLTNVDPAPFQRIDSNLSSANQFYLGIRENNGSYERTTVYRNINQSTLNKLNLLKSTSTERGFEEYSIARNGSYTTIRIRGADFGTVLAEEDS